MIRRSLQSSNWIRFSLNFVFYLSFSFILLSSIQFPHLSNYPESFCYWLITSEHLWETNKWMLIFQNYRIHGIWKFGMATKVIGNSLLRCSWDVFVLIGCKITIEIASTCIRSVINFSYIWSFSSYIWSFSYLIVQCSLSVSILFSYRTSCQFDNLGDRTAKLDSHCGRVVSLQESLARTGTPWMVQRAPFWFAFYILIFITVHIWYFNAFLLQIQSLYKILRYWALN